MSTRLDALISCCGLCCWLAAVQVSALDGSTISMGTNSAGPSASAESATAEPTYYESLLAATGPEDFESTEPGLASRLALHDSSATASYVSGPGKDSWTLKLRGLDRPHERVDAVYQMIAVLPLPVGADREPAFQTQKIGISVREGSERSSVPLIYGGEKIVLKRNVALEKSLLPGLIGEAYEGDKLPSLEGTGYDYTLWDTIVRHDASHGDTLQVLADVRYSTIGPVAPPDAGDERLKAYVLTWIPGMDPRHPIFAIRIDVVDQAE